MMDRKRTLMLRRLADTDLTVADPLQDIRGRPVFDRDGTALGMVDALYIDQTRKQVRLLRVASGGILGFGSVKTLIPVEAVTGVTLDNVYVDVNASRAPDSRDTDARATQDARAARERDADRPQYRPLLAENDEWIGVYPHYGYPPFWLSAGLPPMTPPAASAPPARRASRAL